MKSAKESSVLDRLVSRLSTCLTAESARKLVALKSDAATRARVEHLARDHQLGLLTPEEQAEYGKYISYSTFVAILKSKARQLLAQTRGQ
jgi:hypothetical protein